MYKKVVIFLACLLFVFHFTFTAIYLAPFNPIKAKYGFIVNAYMEPFFSQNWKLFAPNPASNNNVFFARAKFADGSVSEWMDLTSFMIEKNYQNRLSPYNRLVRIQRGAFNSLRSKDDVIVLLSKKIEEKKLEREPYRNILKNETQKKQREEAIQTLNRYAQSYLSTVFTDHAIEKTQILLQETEAVPYSKRGDDTYESESRKYRFDWADFEPVASIF